MSDAYHCPEHGWQNVIDEHDEAICEAAGMYATREVAVVVADLACGCPHVRETGQVTFT